MKYKVGQRVIIIGTTELLDGIIEDDNFLIIANTFPRYRVRIGGHLRICAEEDIVGAVPPDKCVCGAATVNSKRHSSWCEVM